jgi:hypothetical protein
LPQCLLDFSAAKKERISGNVSYLWKIAQQRKQKSMPATYLGKAPIGQGIRAPPGQPSSLIVCRKTICSVGGFIYLGVVFPVVVSMAFFLVGVQWIRTGRVFYRSHGLVILPPSQFTRLTRFCIRTKAIFDWMLKVFLAHASSQSDVLPI